jgi:hypothetical protein
MLPLKNQFLKDRNNGMMSKARADLDSAVDTLLAASNYFYVSGNAQLPQAVKDKLNDYQWINGGNGLLTQLKKALDGEGDFYYSTTAPAGTAWYTSGTAEYGVNINKLFTPGQLAVDKFLNAEIGGKSPVFFGFASGDTVNGTEITAQSQFTDYSNVGLQFNFIPIKEVFVKGFESYGDKDWFHKLYADALLTQDNGQKLYRLYHMGH